MATLHLHFYLPVVAGNYSIDKFVDYLRGSVDPTTPEEASMPPSDRFADAGVTLDFQKKNSFRHRRLQEVASGHRFCRRLPGALGAGF